MYNQQSTLLSILIYIRDYMVSKGAVRAFGIATRGGIREVPGRFANFSPSIETTVCILSSPSSKDIPVARIMAGQSCRLLEGEGLVTE